MPVYEASAPTEHPLKTTLAQISICYLLETPYNPRRSPGVPVAEERADLYSSASALDPTGACGLELPN